MVIAWSMLAIFVFVVASLVYVYRFRGQERYENFSEYVRKGWPVFTPLNCLLYIFTERRARLPIMNLEKFPELEEVRKNWSIIREEVLNLHQNRLFESTNKTGTAASYDLGFRTFFKYGWSKFYLTWYGYTHESAQRLCPKTVEILKRVPCVNGAMFSVLPSGSQLTRHLDPIACSLRYHLGLATPNDDKCFINIDGQSYSWRDGDALLFDETYIHYAKNNASGDRLILMCDVERPMFGIGRIVNFIYKGLARLTVVPNMEGDKRGLVNTIFGGLAPVIQKTKALKQTNRPLYLVVKHTVNLTLIVIVFAIIAGLIGLFNRLAVLLMT